MNLKNIFHISISCLSFFSQEKQRCVWHHFGEGHREIPTSPEEEEEEEGNEELEAPDEETAQKAQAEQGEIRKAAEANKENDSSNAENLLADLKTRQTEIKEGEEKSNTPEKAGFMVIIERLIDKLTKLAESLGGKVDKWLKKQQRKGKFEASLLEANKTIKLAEKYERGKGIAIEVGKNEEVFNVRKGTVTDAGEGKIEIKFEDDSKIIYKNVTPESGMSDGVIVEAGQKIGKASDTKIFFQYFDNKNQEIDPTGKLIM